MSSHDYKHLGCSKAMLLAVARLAMLIINGEAHAGELEASVLDYSFVLQIEADHVEATFHRGTVYEKLGKLDEAIADFSKVLSLEPDHVKASYARGTCRNLKGDFAPAIGAFAAPKHAVFDLAGLMDWLPAYNEMFAKRWPNESLRAEASKDMLCRGLCQGTGEGQAGSQATAQEPHPAWC